MALPRKITKFQLCARHARYDYYVTKRRLAEIFDEGGFATLRGCDPEQPCRMWPGTDFFVASYCMGEANLDWTKGFEEDDSRVIAPCSFLTERNKLMKKNMGNLQPGDFVTLRFNTGSDSYLENATFLGDLEDVDGVYKKFESYPVGGKPYTWESYRYKGNWVYGTSAQRVTVAQDS